jgi:hypothetical protein
VRLPDVTNGAQFVGKSHEAAQPGQQRTGRGPDRSDDIGGTIGTGQSRMPHRAGQDHRYLGAAEQVNQERRFRDGVRTLHVHRS